MNNIELIVERMRERGYDWTICNSSDNNQPAWSVLVINPKKEYYKQTIGRAKNDSLLLAICRAVLQVTGEKENAVNK